MAKTCKKHPIAIKVGVAKMPQKRLTSTLVLAGGPVPVVVPGECCGLPGLDDLLGSAAGECWRAFTAGSADLMRTSGQEKAPKR